MLPIRGYFGLPNDAVVPESILVRSWHPAIPRPPGGYSEQRSSKPELVRGFVGYGDADPSNVSPLVHGAEMRVAETRAVNRALRKAYGIGICSVEEIGSFAEAGSILTGVEEAPTPAGQWQERKLRRTQGSRPPLPAYPPAPTRCQSREVLRR